MRLYALSIILVFLGIKTYSQDGYISGIPALAYWKVGNKSETVIVLHGGPAVQHDYLRPEFDALKKVAKVIYYDQRGCGKSQIAPSYFWKEHIEDLNRVIETFSKNRKVILAGSSWGTKLALIYTYYYPDNVKGLILSGTVKWWGEQMNENYYKENKSKSFRNVETEILESKIEEKRIVKTKSKIDTIDVFKVITTYYGPPFSETKASFKTAPVIDSLSQVKVPVLIFKGTRKPYRPYLEDWGSIYQSILPNAKLHIINYAGHDPWLSNPEEFFNNSIAFVKKLKKRGKKRLR